MGFVALNLAGLLTSKKILEAGLASLARAFVAELASNEGAARGSLRWMHVYRF
jgi:hypothetical protein